MNDGRQTVSQSDKKKNGLNVKIWIKIEKNLPVSATCVQKFKDIFNDYRSKTLRENLKNKTFLKLEIKNLKNFKGMNN